MEPITVLTALLPTVIDGVKAFVSRKTGGAPAVVSADDYAKVIDADVRRLQALASLDQAAGPTSTWVANVRHMQRPTAGAVVLLSWCLGAMALVDMDAARFELVSNLASSVFFYLFGERTNMYLRKRLA